MANIAVINYCNLSCPYCFADEFLTEDKKQIMTMEQLEKILEFIGRTTVHRVGLIGGEPTIHPQFSQILERVREFCKMHHSNCTIFSNGIRLSEYVRLFDDNVGCLINLNHPDIVGETNWKSIIKSLDRLKLCSALDRVNLGINLYRTMIDYDYIFDLALLYHKEQVRASYVAPTCQCSTVDKDDYYISAKDIFIPFVEKARSRGVHIHLDCNHIPRCYFTDSELSMIDSVVDGFHNYCEPVIDITPDYKCTACFGAYQLLEMDRFENIQEVERYLRYKRLYPLAEANNKGKCQDCSRHDNLACQGGCLAFASREKE